MKMMELFIIIASILFCLPDSSLALTWLSTPGEMIACTGDDVTFHWEYDTQDERVTMILIINAETERTFLTYYVDDSDVKEFPEYRGRTKFIEHSQEGTKFILKNVTKMDSVGYIIQLGGLTDARNLVANLKVYDSPIQTSHLGIMLAGLVGLAVIVAVTVVLVRKKLNNNKNDNPMTSGRHCSDNTVENPLLSHEADNSKVGTSEQSHDIKLAPEYQEQERSSILRKSEQERSSICRTPEQERSSICRTSDELVNQAAKLLEKAGERQIPRGSKDVNNTRLLQIYNKCDKRVELLVFIITKWASKVRINNDRDDFPNNYCWTLLVIFYLQAGCHPPVVPCLHKQYNSLVFGKSEEDEVPDPHFTSKNEQSLQELRTGFFKYYCDTISCGQVFSLRAGQLLSKKLLSSRKPHHQWQYLLCVEDPSSGDNVLSYGIKEAHFQMIVQALNDEVDCIKKKGVGNDSSM